MTVSDRDRRGAPSTRPRKNASSVRRFIYILIGYPYFPPNWPPFFSRARSRLLSLSSLQQRKGERINQRKGDSDRGGDEQWRNAPGDKCRPGKVDDFSLRLTALPPLRFANLIFRAIWYGREMRSSYWRPMFIYEFSKLYPRVRWINFVLALLNSCFSQTCYKFIVVLFMPTLWTKHIQIEKLTCFYLQF